MCVDSVVTSFFAEEITKKEAEILRVPLGDSAAQQAFEAFAALIALRLWSPLWKGERMTLSIKSDSVSALSLVLNLRTSGFGCNLVAREIALDVAEMAYRPDVVEHVRGVSNISADCLSRLCQPGSKYEIPPEFENVTRAIPQTRNRELFRTLGTPPM